MGAFRRVRKKLKELVNRKASKAASASASAALPLGFSRNEALDSAKGSPTTTSTEVSSITAHSTKTTLPETNETTSILSDSDAVNRDTTSVQADILHAPRLQQRPFSAPESSLVTNCNHCSVSLLPTMNFHSKAVPELRSPTADSLSHPFQSKPERKKPILSEAAARVLGIPPHAYIKQTVF